MRFTHPIIFLCLFYLAVFKVYAETERICPSDSELIGFTHSTDNKRSISILKAHEEDCKDNAVFHATLGALYLQSNQLTQAQIQLENALMLNPELGGAQLDYAEVLAKVGNRSASLDLLGQVFVRSDLPNGLKTWLSEVVGSDQNLLDNKWHWQGTFESSIGRETNINNAPASNIIYLSLPNGLIPVQDLNLESPQAVDLTRENLYLVGKKQWGDSLVTVNFYNSYKYVPTVNRFSSNFLDTSLVYEKLTTSGGYGVSQGFTSLLFGGQNLFRGISSQGFYNHNLLNKNCQGVINIDRVMNQYPGNSILNGQFYGVGTGLNCKVMQGLLTMHIEIGNNVADTQQRLGGDERVYNYLISYLNSYKMFTYEFTASLNQVNDSRQYSDLIGNLTRYIDNNLLKIKVYYPFLKNKLNGFVEYGYNKQSSNLSLFQLNDNYLQIGLSFNIK